MPVMKGLVWSAIVLSVLALTGLAQIPNRVQECQDRQIRATAALRDSPRATVVAPGIDQHAILPDLQGRLLGKAVKCSPSTRSLGGSGWTLDGGTAESRIPLSGNAGSRAVGQAANNWRIARANSLVLRYASVILGVNHNI